MNAQRQISIFFILSGISIVILTLFPTMLPGADSAFGPVQTSLLLTGLGIILLGFDFDHQPYEHKMGLLHFIQYQAGTFILWFTGTTLYALVIIISPRFSFIMKNSEFLKGCAILFFVIGVLRRLWQALASTRLIHFFRSTLNRTQNFPWGIALLFLSLFVGFYSDIIRGSLLVFSVFFLIGIGPALFLFSPNQRSDYAVAFAPVIGFALMAIIGSWLVVMDLPVQKWTPGGTTSLLVVSGFLILLWRKNFPSEWQAINGWRLFNEFGLACGVVLLIIAPVAIGGLKFSVFRGNQGDARNYMSMAAFLNSIPFSARAARQVLFDTNPALLWAVSFLHTRWATSMLMAYAVKVSQIPLYRFDFAFTSLPFALVFAPLRVYLRSYSMHPCNAFLLALSVSAGYYAQVVQDSRAVSYATAVPVIIVFVLLVARILDDECFYYKNQPVYFGEGLLLVILVTALFLLYTEFFVLLIFGMALSVLYYFTKGILPLKKFFLILAFSVTGILLVASTIPLYIKFFISQIIGSQQLFVNWHLAFFPWIFEDAPAGIWGLNPYQLAPLLSLFLQGAGWVLMFFLFAGFVHLFIVGNKVSNIFRLSALLTLGGMIIFAYAFFRNQLWQAGKFITYLYPFLILYMGLIPSIFKEIHLPKTFSRFPKFLQVGITLWLVSQAALGGYRFFVTAKGFEYPYHVRYAGHTYKTYATKYAWNVSSFLEKIQSVENPEIWVSTDDIFSDNFWALILNQKARVLVTQPTMDQANTLELLFNSSLLAPPDFIIMSNSAWDSNKREDADWKTSPILYQDERYSLVQTRRQYPEHVMLIGMRSDPYFIQIQVIPEFVISNIASGNTASLVFLSPKACHVSISAEAFIYPHKSAEAILQVDSYPANKHPQIEIQDTQNIQILVDINKGYNFLPFKITSPVSGEPKTLTMALTNLRFTEVSCSNK